MGEVREVGFTAEDADKNKLSTVYTSWYPHVVPTSDILSLLLAERTKLDADRAKLDRAIAALQGGRRRGRPPKSKAGGAGAAIPSPFRKRGRRRMSKAAREAASRRMKKYWAERKKAEKQKR